MIGRSRSKSRALQGMRSRMISSDVEIGLTEEPPMVSQSRSSIPRRQVKMADMVLPRWHDARGGQPRKFLVKKWVRRCLGNFLLFLCMLMLLWYFLNTGDHNMQNGDNPNGQSLEKPSMWENMLNFFFPTTCVPKDNQELKPCDNGADLKASACLKGKCCYLPRADNFTCFAPFKDKPTQWIRLFTFGIISMVGMGCLPIYCFSICRNSTWANSLRQTIIRGLKRLKNQRKRHKTDPEMFEMAMEGLEIFGERKEEEETKALLSD